MSLFLLVLLVVLAALNKERRQKIAVWLVCRWGSVKIHRMDLSEYRVDVTGHFMSKWLYLDFSRYSTYDYVDETVFWYERGYICIGDFCLHFYHKENRVKAPPRRYDYAF